MFNHHFSPSALIRARGTLLLERTTEIVRGSDAFTLVDVKEKYDHRTVSRLLGAALLGTRVLQLNDFFWKKKNQIIWIDQDKDKLMRMCLSHKRKVKAMQDCLEPDLFQVYRKLINGTATAVVEITMG